MLSELKQATLNKQADLDYLFNAYSIILQEKDNVLSNLNTYLASLTIAPKNLFNVLDKEAKSKFSIDIRQRVLQLLNDYVANIYDGCSVKISAVNLNPFAIITDKGSVIRVNWESKTYGGTVEWSSEKYYERVNQDLESGIRESKAAINRYTEVLKRPLIGLLKDNNRFIKNPICYIAKQCSTLLVHPFKKKEYINILTQLIKNYEDGIKSSHKEIKRNQEKWKKQRELKPEIDKIFKVWEEHLKGLGFREIKSNSPELY
ncbi:hypothetical protein P9173_09590 [Bacillus safensis]|uniref:hypothetical protein n=1 Tax=Bacillus safensis TaxID=561879 RepID=UPI002282ED87|nr:hypothetical protein [Bacillus safensis]MCY7542446.1 hypothetical protein [Bacillus safensis]MCY7552565.1 hypothetical protein [Bacillus safensis]MCY7644752.1 hypothetical protein [Bacillus safensis]MCY7655933.1 hypothetical protein [Bacillus safensis]MEC3710408.1 hypothetical protein [Bacillus safensis]